MKSPRKSPRSPLPAPRSDDFRILSDKLSALGLNVEEIKTRLKNQRIETPSWGYSDSGTRFGTFAQPGAAVTIWEKIADAATVHRFTGVCPSVAVHVLWDFTDKTPPDKVKAFAEEHGVRIGSINPNVFQDRDYKLGSIANRDPRIRKKAVRHILDSIRLARTVDSRVLSLWFADGTNYPGQADIRSRKHWVQESLAEVYAATPDDMTVLLEYKFFEPAFYMTDIADWGMSYAFCKKMGERAKVLVDLGHHAHGVNIEHIVAYLLDEQMLGGFHFNNRKYADDDLTVGSVNPYELFLIFCELTQPKEQGTRNKEQTGNQNKRGKENSSFFPPPSSLSDDGIEYMIDQSANLKLKIEDMIQTVMQIQSAYAKALCVPRIKLAEAQANDDIALAEQLLVDAFNTDVRPLLAAVREELGIASNPLAAYRQSGYQQKIEKDRGNRKGTGGLGQAAC
jgi:L-rhamnose isomerase/sugar isomerase